MKDIYYKYQWFYLIIVICFFAYALFYFYNDNLQKNVIVEKHRIAQKRCSAAPRITSFIQVEKNNKTYTVDLSKQKCVNSSIGDTVILYYNQKYDYFYTSDRNRVSLSRIIISGIAIVVLLLPWKYIVRKIRR